MASRRLASPLLALFLFWPAGLRADDLPWETDWSTAFGMARQEQKLVFVDYFATWCGPCKVMDAKVFPDPQIQRRLAGFVRLRVDVDKGGVARAHAIQAMPTYAVYDPGERERFRFMGSKTVPILTAALDEIGSVAPMMLQASSLVDAKDTARSALFVGNAYRQIGMGIEARNAYDASRKAFQKQGDAAAAQIAEADSAFTWAMTKNAGKAVSLLETLSASPASPENEPALFYLLAQAKGIGGDRRGADEAHRRVVALSPAGSPLHEASVRALSHVP